MGYFEQTKRGLSVWWSWILVTWLAFVGWVIVQTTLVSALMDVASEKDPEIGVAFNEAAMNMMPEEQMAAYALSGLVLLVAGIASIILSLVTITKTLSFLNAQPELGRPKVSPVLLGATLLSIVIAIIGLMYNSSLIEQGDYMAVMNRAMGVSPIAFGLFLLTFPAGAAALYLGQKFVHRRTLLSLHTAAAKFRWFWVAQGFLVTWAVLGLFSWLGQMLGLMEIAFVFDASRFWGFAIVSLLLIPLQSATEEIVFRGYFNQGLMHLLGNKWVAFTITSLAFMALHLSNPEALAVDRSILPIVMSSYFFFGFAACLLVLFDDGLETAIGVHAGNNCFAATMLNYENSVLPTPSVFLTGSDPLKDAISTLVVLGLIVVIFWMLRRRSRG
jgi:membrane protease YdiL (CAAX protease family)